MQNAKVQASYYKLKRNSKINHEVTQYKLQLGAGATSLPLHEPRSSRALGGTALHPRAPSPLSVWLRRPALVLGSSAAGPCPAPRPGRLPSLPAPSPQQGCHQLSLAARSWGSQHNSPHLCPAQGLPSAVPLHLC